MRKKKSITMTIVAADGTRYRVSGRFETSNANELVERAIGEFLPAGSRPLRLVRGGMTVAAYNPFAPLGEFGVRDGDVLETTIDVGQPLVEPCFLGAYRVVTGSLARYEALAQASAAINGHLPPAIVPSARAGG